MVLYDAYYIRCLFSSFSAISRRFIIRARVGDDILDFCGLFISLATLSAVRWITSVMVSFMVSMSPSYCSVSNRFLNSSCNFIFCDLICVESLFGGLLVINMFLSTSTSSLMLLIAILWSIPLLTWLIIVTSVTMSGLGLPHVWSFPYLSIEVSHHYRVVVLFPQNHIGVVVKPIYVFFLSTMLFVHILALSLVCNACLCTEQVLLLWS